MIEGWEIVTVGEMINNWVMTMDDFREITSEDDVEEGAEAAPTISY